MVMEHVTLLLNLATYVIACHEGTRILFRILDRNRERRMYSACRRLMEVA